MADISDGSFRTGDVLTFEGTVRWTHQPNDGDVAVAAPGERTFYVPRSAIISVRPALNEGDLVEHTAGGREGLVRHVHDGLAWVAWSSRDENTVVPTADLVRLRTALEMAAVIEPAPLPPVPVPVDASDTGPADEGVLG